MEKLLTFDIGIKTFGVDILKVREILGYLIPDANNFIHLRGSVIPIVDFSEQLGVRRHDVDEMTCIIIIETENDEIKGFVADQVREVIDAEANEETGQAEVIDIEAVIENNS
jgi:purine-binding chemotaxis protein CheW